MYISKEIRKKQKKTYLWPKRRETRRLGPLPLFPVILSKSEVLEVEVVDVEQVFVAQWLWTRAGGDVDGVGVAAAKYKWLVIK